MSDLSSIVELKDGRSFQMDFSASTIKHFRRTGKVLERKNEKGELEMINAKDIKKITRVYL